jgi:hypothetical protein
MFWTGIFKAYVCFPILVGSLLLVSLVRKYEDLVIKVIKEKKMLWSKKDIKFDKMLQVRFSKGHCYQNEVFYVVMSLANDISLELTDLLRWDFGIDLYSNVVGKHKDFDNFQFSRSYPYSILTPLIDGCLDMNLRYLVLLYVFQDLIISDIADMDDLEFQVYDDFQGVAEEIAVLFDFIYFIGFGTDKLISYNEFDYFIRYLIRCNSGSNAWVIILLVRNICFSATHAVTSMYH